MYAECQLESIQHIHALRTELENSLISDDSPIDSERRQQQLRQLRTVFRSDEAVHIQFSVYFKFIFLGNFWLWLANFLCQVKLYESIGAL